MSSKEPRQSDSVMSDKEIRSILISYLQAQGRELRIYQEKSIGSSICDLMVVSDVITGFEIKSDLDNYQRLEEQVRTYDRFFDRNYLVVGQTHAASATARVPQHWGILCIEKDRVTLLRTAKDNIAVSRRSQLSVLWKLELKNILLKNEMPLFAQKEKGYIADRIAEQVEDAVLQKQIAYELLHRDYSAFDGANDYSIHLQELSFDLPAQELVDMLSENDLDSFTLDRWIELYQKARELREKKGALFVETPKQPRTPHEIPYTDIEVSLGAPWISVSIINDFIGYIMYGREGSSSLCKYEPVTGNWYIERKQCYDELTNLTVKYGTARYNALYIIEASLNLREIKLCDRKGKYDERDTVAALEKQKRIEQEFKDWIWLDEDRRWEVEEAYNKLFGGYHKQSYDGSRLRFEGMSPAYELYPYQKDAVQRILENKNTLLAFDVGAGKTYIMIAAAMKMRQEGLSRKNLFVVPNHIVGQWEKIFTELYPKAKIVAVEPKGFKPAMRQKVLRQIKEGDYDGIIMAYSCFEMIPLSERVVLDHMNRQLTRIEEAISELRTGYNNWQRDVLQREKQRITKITMEFLKTMDDPAQSSVSFADLEISTLFLDEAHNYKNLPIKTRLKNLNGINTTGSAKCMDLLHKIRCVQNAPNGRGAVFATGTPLCNSISDAYAMQVYLQIEQLEESHLDQFDNWVKTFAKPEQRMEIDVDTSRYRMVRKFVQFHNLPELSRMFSQIAAFYAIGADTELPELEGYSDVVIPRYPALSAYMKKLCQRTEEIRSGKISPKFDNMLKVSTDGRKAALDLTLVGASQPYDESAKVFRCVQNVMALYDQHPGCTQLIFCDYSTPKGEDFSVYRELKCRLTDAGIPEKEISFIHSYHTESRKVELFRNFNEGKVRVLIGSTFKLGIGANVQVKLKAIHHLDVPWRPADMVQREGRILRRGNENQSVMIFRYITEGSFDAYSWQILETKQRFISQFLAGSSYQRTVSDLEDNVLSYAEVKALALDEPLMKQLAELENEVKSLQIVAAKEQETADRMQAELSETKDLLRQLLYRRLHAKRTKQKLEKYTGEELKADAQRVAGVLSAENTEQTLPLPLSLPAFACFSIGLPAEQNPTKPFFCLYDEDEQYLLEFGVSPKGTARRIMNFAANFDRILQQLDAQEAAASRRQRALEKALSSPDDTTRHRLLQQEAELRQLRQRLGAGKMMRALRE